MEKANNFAKQSKSNINPLTDKGEVIANFRKKIQDKKTPTFTEVMDFLKTTNPNETITPFIATVYGYVIDPNTEFNIAQKKKILKKNGINLNTKLKTKRLDTTNEADKKLDENNITAKKNKIDHQVHISVKKFNNFIKLVDMFEITKEEIRSTS